MVMTVEERKANKKAYMDKYRVENKAKIVIANKKYRAENKEKLRLAKLMYRANAKNREYERVANAKYAANNRAKCAATLAKYRATRFGATIYMTKEDRAKINSLYAIAKDATKLFGYTWEVDHIVPLAKGGLHKLSNLQVVPMTWNRSKGDRNCATYWD